MYRSFTGRRFGALGNRHFISFFHCVLRLALRWGLRNATPNSLVQFYRLRLTVYAPRSVAYVDSGICNRNPKQRREKVTEAAEA